MPREKVDFRDNMALLNEMFPGKLALSVDEAIRATGLSRKRISEDATFPKKKSGQRVLVPKVGLARWLCVSDA